MSSARSEGHAKLLEHGASLSAQDVDKLTQLHLASRGYTDIDPGIKQVLLEYDADAKAYGMQGWTALHHASRGAHIEATWFLLLECDADANAPDQDKSTPLHVASGCGHVDIVRVLLEHGADANVQDKSSWTPLQLASEEGHLEVVRLLLDRGGNVDAENEDQQTPLSLASGNGRQEVVQLLLENRANLNRPDWLWRTALHVASENGHNDVMLLLLNRGANVNAKDAQSWTPLHMASKIGNRAGTLELLNCGAEVGAKNDLCWTPLHMASQEGHWRVVELLLDRHAYVDTRDGDFETALHLAAYYGHPKVTKLLLDRGADVQAINKNGKTPYKLASIRGHHDVAKLLGFEATQPIAPQNTSNRDPGAAYSVQGGQFRAPSRPHSIAELAERAEQSLGDDVRPFKAWLRIAENARRDAKTFYEQADLESAFVEYAKAATLVLEKIPAHPDYMVLLSPTQRHNLGLHGQQILDSLAEIKAPIMTRYEQWRANPSSLQSQTPSTSRFPRETAHLPPVDPAPLSPRSSSPLSTISDNGSLGSGASSRSGISRDESRPPITADKQPDSGHACPHCSKRFNRPSSLAIHVSTHTGDKPFKCPFPNCGREFNVNSNMLRHYKRHLTSATPQAPRQGSSSYSSQGSPGLDIENIRFNDHQPDTHSPEVGSAPPADSSDTRGPRAANTR